MNVTPKKSSESLERMIEQYNQEMLRLYAQQIKKPQPTVQATTQAAVTTIALAAVPEEKTAPAEIPAMALPSDQAEAKNGGEELVVEPIEEPMPAPAQMTDEENADFPMTDTGYIQVRTFTAREAIPIEGALVTITQEDGNGTKLQWALVTDKDGLTPTVAVPTVSSTLSLQPGVEHPYSQYTIQVDMPGYYRVKNIDVPVYGGITALQPVELIPLPEGTIGTPEVVFPETGPEEL